MENLTLFYFIFTVFVTLSNVNWIYHTVMLLELENNNIITTTQESIFNDKIVPVLNSVQIIFSFSAYGMMYKHDNVIIHPAALLATLFLVYFLTMIFSIIMSSSLDWMMLYFLGSKQGKNTPKALIEFKMDALKLVKDSPKYLTSYKLIIKDTIEDTVSIDDDTDDDDLDDLDSYAGINLLMSDIDFRMAEINRLMSSLKEFCDDEDVDLDADIDLSHSRFPLFEQLTILTKSIFSDDLNEMNESSLLNAYLIENITLLSTIMTILKDEKLVKSLSSELGLTELTDLTERFSVLNSNMSKKLSSIENEKERYAKASEVTEIVEGLNEVRSMKEMLDSLK